MEAFAPQTQKLFFKEEIVFFYLQKPAYSINASWMHNFGVWFGKGTDERQLHGQQQIWQVAHILRW